MSRVLIEAKPAESREVQGHALEIAEMFIDTIQGEGVNTGVPASFIRVQHCSLNCAWCDSEEVWRYGNPYTVDEILDLLEENEMIEKFRNGQHLILTGGSPLRQQFELVSLIEGFIERFGFKPYIEIENEAVIEPREIVKYIDCWNNSPKLMSSGNTKRARMKPDILRKLSSFENSWFKFVVTDEIDWNEIYTQFLEPGLIKREQIILMPEGATREELQDTRELTVNIAIREGVRFSDRQHIVLWDKKTGV